MSRVSTSKLPTKVNFWQIGFKSLAEDAESDAKIKIGDAASPIFFSSFVASLMPQKRKTVFQPMLRFY